MPRSHSLIIGVAWRHKECDQSRPRGSARQEAEAVDAISRLWDASHFALTGKAGPHSPMSESLFVSDVAALQISKYFNVAGLAILIYDFVVTIEDESRCIWGKPWDPTRVIFTISRYLPFAGVAFTAYDTLRSPYGSCPSVSIEENILHILGIIAAELLLLLRTYALWACDKRILYGLLTYGVLMVAGAVTMDLFPPSKLGYNEPDPGVAGVCELVSDSRDPALVYTFLLAFELVVFTLTVVRRFHDNWGWTSRASLLRTIYRDGVLYMACIMLITIANILCDAAFPIEYSDMLDTLQITLHSVLASRIMFNIRKTVKVVHGGTSDRPVELHALSISDIQYDAHLPSQASTGMSFGCSDETHRELVMDIRKVEDLV